MLGMFKDNPKFDPLPSPVKSSPMDNVKDLSLPNPGDSLSIRRDNSDL